MNKKNKFLVAVAFQVAIILTIILFKLTVLGSGTEVILRIAPVDPTSPLRGDYMTFSYANLSTLNSNLFSSNSELREGSTVYVYLKHNGDYWVPSAARTSKTNDNKNLYIKGTVASLTRNNTGNNGFGKSANISTAQIIYGIEEYFIPEGVGRNFDLTGKEVSARVAVDDNGNAVLKGLIIDGYPWP